MKITALSDLHRDNEVLKTLEPSDVLILAGDYDIRNYYDHYDFIKDIIKIKDKFDIIFIVPGNHDFYYQKSEMVSHENNIHFLIHQEYKYKDKLFFGTPYVNMFRNWAFEKNTEDMKKFFSQIPNDIDVLISHTPPEGILDRNNKGRRCGSPELTERIKSFDKNVTHIFGHIHHEHGRILSKKYSAYNVSIMNDDYQNVNKPTIIEI